MFRDDTGELFSRQAEMVNARIHDVSVAIVGIGGIGSNAFRSLVRTGVTNFTLYDGDEVEAGNVLPGAFGIADVGEPKTEAMKARMEEEIGGELAVEIRGWFDPDEDHEYHDVWIVGTDNMESRRHVWSVVRRDSLFDLYVDARMGGAGYEIHTVRADDYDQRQSFQRNHLDRVNDQDLPCGLKSTSFVTGMIASIVARRVRALANDSIRDEPAIVIFDADDGVYATA